MKLTVKDVSKTYKNGVKALENVSFELNTGMVGLLGPNGAGKSSLMRTISTLQLPDSGTIYFNNIDIVDSPIELRKQLGYLPQSFGVYPKMTCERMLNYFAVLKGLTSKEQRQYKVQEVMEKTNLTKHAKTDVFDFSGGMKQRFGIAQLLINDPEIIIVDEPTAGLDPKERRRFLNLLREISTKSLVILSTHIVEDVKEVCTELVLINEGSILDQISPKNAVDKIKNCVWKKNISSSELEHYKNSGRFISESYNELNQIEIRAYSKEDLTPEFDSAEPSLEDYYFIKLNELQ